MHFWLSAEISTVWPLFGKRSIWILRHNVLFTSEHILKLRNSLNFPIFQNIYKTPQSATYYFKINVTVSGEIETDSVQTSYKVPGFSCGYSGTFHSKMYLHSKLYLSLLFAKNWSARQRETQIYRDSPHHRSILIKKTRTKAKPEYSHDNALAYIFIVLMYLKNTPKVFLKKSLSSLIQY